MSKTNRLPPAMLVLKRELGDALRAAGAFPSDRKLRAWAEVNSLGGVRHETYQAFKSSRPAPVHHFVQLAEVCLDPQAPKHRMVLDIVQNFATRNGHGDVRSLPPVRLRQLLGENPELVDAFMASRDFFMRVVDEVGTPSNHARPVSLGMKDRAADVHKAVSWLFADLGRALSREPISIDNARMLAAMRIGLAFEDYMERAMAWAARERWAIVFAREANRDVGVSICLPVTAAGYESVRSGKRKPYDTPPSTLRSPSAHILVESFSMEPLPDVARSQQPRAALLQSLVIQFAYLSCVQDLPTRIPLRMLGFAGKPENIRRGASTGFLPTGTFVRDTRIPFLECVIDLAVDFNGSIDRRANAARNKGSLELLQHLLGGPRPVRRDALPATVRDRRARPGGRAASNARSQHDDGAE